MRVARTLQTGTAAGQREVLQKSHCAGSRQFGVLLPEIPMKHQGFITVLFAAPRKHPRTIQTYSSKYDFATVLFMCIFLFGFHRQSTVYVTSESCHQLSPKLLGVWKPDTKLHPKKKEPVLALVVHILGEGGRPPT